MMTWPADIGQPTLASQHWPKSQTDISDIFICQIPCWTPPLIFFTFWSDQLIRESAFGNLRLGGLRISKGKRFWGPRPPESEILGTQNPRIRDSGGGGFGETALSICCGQHFPGQAKHSLGSRLRPRLPSYLIRWTPTEQFLPWQGKCRIHQPRTAFPRLWGGHGIITICMKSSQFPETGAKNSSVSEKLKSFSSPVSENCGLSPFA